MRELVVATIVSLGLSGCLEVIPHDEEAWARAVEATATSALRAPHRDEESGRFYNPWAPIEEVSPLRWMLSRDSMGHLDDDDYPAEVVKFAGRDLATSPTTPFIVHGGHATFAIRLEGRLVITDPLLSERAAIIRREVDPAFGADDVPDGAIVLISHNHYDHLDRQSVAALADRARFLCPLGLGEYLEKLGARDVTELDWWESHEEDDIRFTSLPTQHWSRRAGQQMNESLWCSWMIEEGGRTVYFGADSGYFKGYREYGRAFPEIDVALLPVGAYEPRWFMHYAHMNIAEALRAFEDLGAEKMIPIQWGVLDLADEPAAWPIYELREALATTHAHLADRVEILPIGGIFEI